MTTRLLIKAAAWYLFASLIVSASMGLMVALIVSISDMEHAEPGIHVMGNQVYEGGTLIGVCSGKPPAVFPKTDDPSVDVTWYPECPR